MPTPSPTPSPPATITIAVAHLAPKPGDFAANQRLIARAVRVAAAHGADWVITPELSESGYEFIDHVPLDRLPQYPDRWLSRMATLANGKDMTLFLGFPQRNSDTFYNAVAAIDPAGRIAGVHQKIDVIPGHNEGWASKGTRDPIHVDGLTVGYYVCADAANPRLTRAYRKDGADILLSSAAWYPAPGMGPLPFWRRLSRQSDVPFVVANTTGHRGRIDFSRSVSGAFVGGKQVVVVRGRRSKIALMEWDRATGTVTAAGASIPLR